MPELAEQMYCSQQIVIPPKFPYILKKYCKSAIKTQPYDLLRWSFEYFRALADHRPPPVKLRLEYPIYSTEGGLTRGCLKVLAQQLSGMVDVPISTVKRSWQGFCLDPMELRRILCLCEVYNRSLTVPFLHFIAVAGGMLTKCLTHTMVLLCEALTKEPDGGSAGIPLRDFLKMYRFLAEVDAGADFKYFGGYREDRIPPPEEEPEEQEDTSIPTEPDVTSEDSFWLFATDFQVLDLLDDKVDKTYRLSQSTNRKLIGKIERSPSVERATQMERDNYISDRKGKPRPSLEVDKQLKRLSALHTEAMEGGTPRPSDVVFKEPEKDSQPNQVDIFVYDEDGNEVPYTLFGEPVVEKAEMGEEFGEEMIEEDKQAPAEEPGLAVADEEEEEGTAYYIALMQKQKQERVEELLRTFEELRAIVDRFNSANYDLGTVAGRQMSTTSGEFIVQHIEKQLLDYIDEQIAILPDPDLKKKKAKPEEVEMVRGLLESFVEDNLEHIIPDVEEVEEEEAPIPEIIMVYAVPGIGPTVEKEYVIDFEDYAKEVTKVQADIIMPRNLRHYLCPPLEKYIEYKYKTTEAENTVKKEEQAPRGGMLTD